MKCPKCGSERIQFGTNTSGGGFSFSDACCGSIILGPLGVLCGACGSDTKTEEFWICQDCGNKFSNSEGQRNQRKEEQAKQISKENYIKDKQIRDEVVKQYGTVTEANKTAAEILRKKNETAKCYNEACEKFVAKSDNKKLKKVAKKAAGASDRYFSFLAFFLIAGIVLLVLGLAPIGLILLGIALIMFLKELWNAIINKSFVDTKFTDASPDNQKLYEEMKAAEKEYEEWQKKLKAISNCDTYEQQENQQ